MIRALVAGYVAAFALAFAGCALLRESHTKTDATLVQQANARTDQHKETDTETTIEKEPDEIFEYDGPNLKKHVIKGKVTKTTKKAETAQGSTASNTGTKLGVKTSEDVTWSVRVLAWLAEWWLWLLGGLVFLLVVAVFKFRLWRFLPFGQFISKAPPTGPTPPSE